MKKLDILDGIYFYLCVLEYFLGFGLGVGDVFGMNCLFFGFGV